MVLRSKSRRSLLAVAMTAAPLGAQAVPAVQTQLPVFGCDTNNALSSINWGDKTSLSVGGGIGATVAPPIGAAVAVALVPAVQKPFVCGDKVFTTGLVVGSDFAINFGQLLGVDPALKIDLKLDSSSYKIDDKSSPVLFKETQTFFKIDLKDVVVTSFDLVIDKWTPQGGLTDKYFVGVQVLSPAGSALSDANSFFKDSTSGDLIFDPPIPGGEAVINLLDAPGSVPEPASVGLFGAALAGLAAAFRRRRTRE